MILSFTYSSLLLSLTILDSCLVQLVVSYWNRPLMSQQYTDGHPPRKLIRQSSDYQIHSLPSFYRPGAFNISHFQQITRFTIFQSIQPCHQEMFLLIGSYIFIQFAQTSHLNRNCFFFLFCQLLRVIIILSTELLKWKKNVPSFLFYFFIFAAPQTAVSFLSLSLSLK